MEKLHREDAEKIGDAIKNIKGILGIDSKYFSDRVMDIVIEAMLNGDKAKAKKFLLQKINIDTKSPHDLTLAKLTGVENPKGDTSPEYISDQITSTIEDYLKEKNIEIGSKNLNTITKIQPENAVSPTSTINSSGLDDQDNTKKNNTTADNSSSTKNVSEATGAQHTSSEKPKIISVPPAVKKDINFNKLGDEISFDEPEPLVKKDVGEKEPVQEMSIEDKEALEKFDKLIKELQEKEKTFNKNSSDDEKIDQMRSLSEEYNIPLSFIEPIYTKNEIEFQNKKKERSKFDFEKREKMIKDIGEMLKQGIDKIVIHGQTKEVGDEVNVEPKFNGSIDTDTRGALFFLNLAKGVNYNKGSYTELAKKGSKGGIKESKTQYYNEKNKKDQTTLYIDTSGERLSFKKGINGKEIFIDHHQQEFSKYATSATELMYEVLVKNKMLESEPWMENMASFVTSVDNLSYVNHENYDVDSLEYQWPKSMFGIYNDVPFEKIPQWFKEGKNPFDPKFTEEELNEVLETTEWTRDADSKINGQKPVERKATLKKIIEEKEKEIGADISNARFAIELMKKRGIKTKSSKIGKVIYNKQDRQKEIDQLDKKRNNIIKIYNGFLVAKALGYDSFATYNEKYNRFMVNTNTYDLEALFAEVKKVVPETVLVRGVMMMQPYGLSKRKDMTEDKFLELLELK
jgi:hypothetical protein